MGDHTRDDESVRSAAVDSNPRRTARWFVEVSSRGGAGLRTETYCIEATQWQLALRAARATRGEGGPLSDLSIELLADGWLAIDPKTGRRYAIRRAPDDASLTTAPGRARRSRREARAKVGANRLSKPLAGTYYGIAFVVEGSGPFPMRMLQHDRCCPASEADVSAIQQIGRRQVTLSRFSRAGKSGPSAGDWRAHGWEVQGVVFHDGETA